MVTSGKYAHACPWCGKLYNSDKCPRCNTQEIHDKFKEAVELLRSILPFEDLLSPEELMMNCIDKFEEIRNFLKGLEK